MLYTRQSSLIILTGILWITTGVIPLGSQSAGCASFCVVSEDDLGENLENKYFTY